MRHWGTRLYGFSAEPIANVTTDGINVQVTALERGRRRYVLVLNPAADRYARGRVLLPTMIGGAVANRAVEVLPSCDRAGGHVVDATRGRIALSVVLRPGDAALFEVF